MGATVKEGVGDGVPVKMLLPGELQPGAVLLVAEMVLENPVNEKAGLLVPLVLLPERLSMMLVVWTMTILFTRNVPSVAKVLVSQPKP